MYCSFNYPCNVTSQRLDNVRISKFLKVVDISTGENLGRGLEGEVCIRGPQIMKGYLNNEEATRKTVKDGWLFTGNGFLLSGSASLCLLLRFPVFLP